MHWRTKSLLADIWFSMREAAVERHKYINTRYENSCPVMMKMHMGVVKAFYGW